jgi:hypothetical protein
LPAQTEPDLFEGAYQPFEGGTLLWITRVDGMTICVLLQDGDFERFKTQTGREP